MSIRYSPRFISRFLACPAPATRGPATVRRAWPYVRDASMGTSFILLQFPEPGDTAIVYIEDHTSSQYLELQADIERYTLVFGQLRASALSPEQSVEFIGQVAASMT
jgi:hypothetical protein